MEVSGQLNFPAVLLPWKCLLLPTEEQAGEGPQSWSRSFGEEKNLLLLYLAFY
jgi:hypothetical protein